MSGQYGVHDYVAEGDVNEYAKAWSADVKVGTWRDGCTSRPRSSGRQLEGGRCWW